MLIAFKILLSYLDSSIQLQQFALEFLLSSIFTLLIVSSVQASFHSKRKEQLGPNKFRKSKKKNRKITLNIFHTTDRPLRHLRVQKYQLEGESKDIYRLLNAAKTVLGKQSHLTVISKKELYVVQKDTLLEKITISSNEFHLSEKLIDLTVKKHHSTLTKFAEELIRCNIQSRLEFINQEGNKIFSNKYVNRGGIRVHEAIKIRISLTKQGDIMVILDPSERWTSYLVDLVDDFQKRDYADSKFFKEFIGYQVSCPSINKGTFSYSGEIVSIERKNWSEVPVKGSRSLKDHWNTKNARKFLEKFNINIPENENRIVKVKVSFSERSLTFPLPVLRIPIDIEKLPEKIFNNEIKAIEPQKRLNKTKSYAKRIFSKPLIIDSIQIKFNKELLTTDAEFFKENFRTGCFKRPTLIFGNNKVVTNEKDSDVNNALKKYGPWTGVKTTKIHYIAPEGTNVDEIHSQLNRGAKLYQLGVFEKQGTTWVKKNGAGRGPSPSSYYVACKNLDNALAQCDNFVCVFILPSFNRNSVYNRCKSALGAKGFASQGISSQIAYKMAHPHIQDRVKNTAKLILALNIYTKTLIPGEAVMMLKSPAAQIPDENLFISAIDVSREHKKKITTAADMVTIDSYGRLLDFGQELPYTGETLTKEATEEWLGERILDALSLAKNLNLNAPTGIVFMYDGKFQRKSLKHFKDGASEAIKELVEDNFITSEFSVNILDITKSTILRIYDDSGSKFISGIWLESVNDNTGYLIASDPFRGTASPLRIRILSQDRNIFNLESVLQFIHELRYLDANSPYKQPRLPINAHMAHNKSKAIRKGRVNSFPY